MWEKFALILSFLELCFIELWVDKRQTNTWGAMYNAALYGDGHIIMYNSNSTQAWKKPSRLPYGSLRWAGPRRYALHTAHAMPTAVIDLQRLKEHNRNCIL